MGYQDLASRQNSTKVIKITVLLLWKGCCLKTIEGGHQVTTDEQSKRHCLPELRDIPAESADLFRAHHQEISLMLNDYLLKYLSSLYKEFDGDIVLAIVLGELAHQNISRLMQRGQLLPRDDNRTPMLEALRDLLLPSNPLSISEATGIPRETVRRKFELLVELGWIERVAHHSYLVTPAVAERFRFGFNLRLFEETLQLCSRLHKVLYQTRMPVKPDE